MANYTTSFSCLLPVGAGNVDAALALYEQMEAECETGHNEIGFEAQRDSDDAASLWLYSDDSRGDVEQVIAYVLQCAEALNLSGVWGFRWGLGCDKPRLDAYGGGAQVLDLGRRESVGWIDCEHWLAQRTGAGGLHAVTAETILQPVAMAQGWTEATQVGVLLGFIDKLIDADPCVADQLRADLAEVAAMADETECSECGKPMFIADGGTSHHVGDGPDGIDYGRDHDHTAIAETAVSP